MMEYTKDEPMDPCEELGCSEHEDEISCKCCEYWQLQQKNKKIKSILKYGVKKATKFIDKVENGYARSTITYADFKAFVKKATKILKDN